MDNKEWQSQLIEAIKTGNANAFEQLARPSETAFGDFLNTQIEQYHFPLTLACANGHTELVAYMLQHGANIGQKENLMGRTPLLLAAEKGDVPMTQLLLQHKANLKPALSDSGDQPLHLAAENGHNEVVNVLLFAGAKVDAKAKGTRQTSLYLAAEKGHLATVKLLLEKGAKVNTLCGDSDETALTAACSNNHAAVVEYLLEQGADPNGIVNEGKPYSFSSFPLQQAASGTIVDMLVKAGADVHAKNRHNDTALHAAVRATNNVSPIEGRVERFMEAVKALLAHGADPLAKNNNHIGTPLALAKLPAVVAMLNKAIGDKQQ